MTEEQFKEIETWAGCFFTRSEIAQIIGADQSEFLNQANDESSPVARAIMRGRLKAQGELRISVIAQARAGSHPAQQSVLKMAEQMRTDELLNDQ